MSAGAGGAQVKETHWQCQNLVNVYEGLLQALGD